MQLSAEENDFHILAAPGIERHQRYDPPGLSDNKRNVLSNVIRFIAQLACQLMPASRFQVCHIRLIADGESQIDSLDIHQ